VKYKDKEVENWIHGMSLELKDKDMKTPLQVIERMVKDYPNDMQLGSKVRWYIHWLRESKKDKKDG
tara:strand:- start:1994 stop:2191 length:198 start_codon:yes stop_codon:yes gene_type:complete